MKRLVFLSVLLLASSTPLLCQNSSSALDTVPSPRLSSEGKLNFSGFEVLKRANGKELGFYPESILAKVRGKWYPQIARLSSANSLRTGFTVIEFAVHKDGSLGNIASIELSGNDPLDAAARDAVTSAAPFAPFPESLRENELKMRMHFGYAQPTSPGAPVCDGPNLGAHPGETVLRKVGNGIVAPQATHHPDPVYSREARRAKYESVVVVAGTVDTGGAFRDVCIVQAAGEGLDEKAIETVRTWKFESAKQQGEPVAVRIGVEVSFRLY